MSYYWLIDVLAVSAEMFLIRKKDANTETSGYKESCRERERERISCEIINELGVSFIDYFSLFK